MLSGLEIPLLVCTSLAPIGHNTTLRKSSISSAES